VRVALVNPPTGRITVAGELLEWAAFSLVEGLPAITSLVWRVRGYRQARAPGHEHFWFTEETPYRDVSRTLAPGVNFTLPAEEADRGYSSWLVTVDALAGDMRRATEEASFELSVALYVEPGELLEDLVLPVEMSELGALMAVPAAAIEAMPVADPVVVEEVLDATPAILLDPWQVG